MEKVWHKISVKNYFLSTNEKEMGDIYIHKVIVLGKKEFKGIPLDCDSVCIWYM